MSVSITISEEKLDRLIEKIIKKVKDEILRDLLKEIVETQKEIISILRQLSERIKQLAEAQRRTEERLNSLAVRVEELAEAQRRTEERLNSLIGEFARLRGDLVEFKVITSLDRILSRFGFVVYLAPYDIRELDAVVEGDGFVGVVEICRTCSLDDVRQVVIGAKKFEEVEGVRPDVLIVFSYTGKISESVLEEAERCGLFSNFLTFK